jgi:hypothetical protein
VPRDISEEGRRALADVSYATAPGPGRVNEDFACAGPDWAIVLDGATPTPGLDNGCIHGVPWLVRHLASSLAQQLIIGREGALTEILAAAIIQTCDAHAGTCDLANPSSPSSTVAITRVTAGQLECLTLGDTPIVLWHRDLSFRLVEDDRLAHLPSGGPWTAEFVSKFRNRKGGFWVASTAPAAAHHAVTSSAHLDDLSAVGMFSDGVTRLVDWYPYNWSVILTKLQAGGPLELISTLRRIERAHPHPYAKQHDDATALFARVSCSPS